MLDSNIIISAILFPKSIISETMKYIILHNEIVICQYTIDEIKNVFNKKFHNKINGMDIFLKKLSYSLFVHEEVKCKKYPHIRDDNDIPILVNAIESDVDLLITGDKDFIGINIEKPKIMTPREYKDKYMSGEKQNSV